MSSGTRPPRTYLDLTKSDWISCRFSEPGCRATSSQRLTNVHVILVSRNDIKFGATHPALSETRSVYKAFPMALQLFCSSPRRERDVYSRREQAFLRLSFSGSFVFCTSPYFFCGYTWPQLIEAAEERRYGAVRLTDKLVWCEHWNVHSMSHSAVPNSESNPNNPWRGQVSKTLEFKGLFHKKNRMCSSEMLRIFHYGAGFCLKFAALARFPHFYDLADVDIEKVGMDVYYGVPMLFIYCSIDENCY